MSRNSGGGAGQASSQHEIPPELNSLLIDFTVAVLVDRPVNIVEYAADYFRRLNEERRSSGQTGLSNHLDDDPDSTSSDFSMFFSHLKFV